MAWEWVAPASGALVGVAGLVGGWFVAAGARSADRRLARDRHDHELRMANGQWHRDRRAEAYIELLDLAEEIGHWVGSAFPMWDTDPPRSMPEIPSAIRQARVWARVAAFAAPEVCDDVKAWRAAVNRALLAAEAVARDELGARSDLHRLRAEEEAARFRLSAAISHDLRVGIGGS